MIFKSLVSKRIVLTLVLIGSLSFIACRGKAGGEAGFAPPPPEVTVIEIAPRTVALPLEYPGRLEGSREVEVRPRVSGILLRRLFNEGSGVRRGETLFEVDPAPYRSEVQAAEASMAEERARLRKAEREIARLEPLLAERAVSRRDYDAAVAEVEQARATVMSAEAELDKAKLDLAWTRVAAPISGVTSRAPLSEGSLVGPESLLTRILQVEPIWVRFSVSDETLLSLNREIAAGKVAAPPADQREIELVLADGDVLPERGRVNFADPRIDASTGSIDLRAELANADSGLVPGQFVRVRVLGLERLAAIVVPQRAVLQGQQGKYVMVLAPGDLAEVRPVEVGDWIGDEWLIEKGLVAGDRVIVDGVSKAVPGTPVTPVTPVAPGGDSSPPPGVEQPTPAAEPETN